MIDSTSLQWWANTVDLHFQGTEILEVFLVSTNMMYILKIRDQEMFSLLFKNYKQSPK